MSDAATQARVAACPTFHEAKAAIHELSPRRLVRLERRLRRRRRRLDTAELTRWAAAREVLRTRGVHVPATRFTD